jgi:hypothetical protein
MPLTRAFFTHKCEGHDEVVQRLERSAYDHAQMMMNRYTLLPHIGHTSVMSAFSVSPAQPSSSEAKQTSNSPTLQGASK